MLQRWTNDAFRSTLHRVVNALGKERYSAPFFYEPNFDTQVRFTVAVAVAVAVEWMTQASGQASKPPCLPLAMGLVLSVFALTHTDTLFHTYDV